MGRKTGESALPNINRVSSKDIIINRDNATPWGVLGNVNGGGFINTYDLCGGDYDGTAVIKVAHNEYPDNPDMLKKIMHRYKLGSRYLGDFLLPSKGFLACHEIGKSVKEKIMILQERVDWIDYDEDTFSPKEMRILAPQIKELQQRIKWFAQQYNAIDNMDNFTRGSTKLKSNPNVLISQDYRVRIGDLTHPDVNRTRKSIDKVLRHRQIKAKPKGGF